MGGLVGFIIYKIFYKSENKKNKGENIKKDSRIKSIIRKESRKRMQNDNKLMLFLVVLLIIRNLNTVYSLYSGKFGQP